MVGKIDVSGLSFFRVFPVDFGSKHNFRRAKRFERFQVTEMLSELRVKWVTRWLFDRALGCALFMKKKSRPTNSEEHGGRGRLAPTAPKGKISDSNLYLSRQ